VGAVQTPVTHVMGLVTVPAEQLWLVHATPFG
jgi:hypothetical protein